MFFPWSFEPLRDVFPLFMSHVGLALKEHKLNFQQWSSTLLIFDGPVTYFSGLLVSLGIGTRETKDNISSVHLSKSLTTP